MLAVLAWLIVVPIFELAALAYRTLARAAQVLRLRAANRLVPVAGRPNESPATRE